MFGGQSPGGSIIPLLLSAFAGFGGILYGYDTGNLSGLMTMPPWIDTFGQEENGVMHLPTARKSLVTSILSAGTFFGALSASPLADHVGRRYGVVCACATFCLGVGLQLDTQWSLFVAGRFIAGLGVGMVSVMCPMYMTETAPRSLRGFIIGLFQWAITIGLLLASVVVNATQHHNGNSSWRIPIAVQFTWATILTLGMLFLPESPRWLILRDRHDTARKALGRLLSLDMNSSQITQEISLITQTLEAEQELGKGSYAECFRNGADRMLLRTLTGMGIQAMQQLTGVNFIFYYGTSFFKSSGISNSFIITIITNVVNVAMTIPGILAIDRVGRRKLLLSGAIVMCACESIIVCVGVSVGQTDDGQTINLTAQRVMIAFVCIYIAGFASTWGPGAYIVCSEVFPLKLRAKGMSLSVASNWLWNFGIGYATPYLVDPSTPEIRTAALGVKVFSIWAATCALSAVFTYFTVPELKGLSLEEVDVLYKNSSILESDRYRSGMLASEENHPRTHEVVKVQAEQPEQAEKVKDLDAVN